MNKKNVNIGVSDDYASAYITDDKWNDLVSMYYGYEVTRCPVHIDENDCYDADCDESQWCFQYTDKDNNKLIITADELEDYCKDIKDRMPENYLLAGILKMIDEGILKIDKTKL